MAEERRSTQQRAHDTVITWIDEDSWSFDQVADYVLATSAESNRRLG